MNILVSFLGSKTPSFDGRIKHCNPKKFNGRVPFYATHFITDDPRIKEIFEKEGVINYGEAQRQKEQEGQEQQQEEQVRSIFDIFPGHQ